MKILIILLMSVATVLATDIDIPTSFSANFTQKITSQKGKIINYSGKMLLNNTGELKWSYKNPTKKEVCSNGNDFTIVDHDLEQVSFYLLNKALDLIEILKNAKHYKGNLYIANYQDRNYTFSLDKTGKIDQIAYKDELDNIVNIHFQNMVYKDTLNSDKLMTCPYPDSFDIIRG